MVAIALGLSSARPTFVFDVLREPHEHPDAGRQTEKNSP